MIGKLLINCKQKICLVKKPSWNDCQWVKWSKYFCVLEEKYQIYTISPWNFPGSYGQANYDDPDSDEVGLAPLPEGKVACLKCGKTLINEASGKRHYASSHQPNQPVKCNICKKVYKNKTTRDQHLRQFHGVTSAMMRNVIKPPPAPSTLEVHDLM